MGKTRSSLRRAGSVAVLEPGEPGVLEFTADIEGRFELETHELGLQLLQLEVG